jgi:hypothetical protein
VPGRSGWMPPCMQISVAPGGPRPVHAVADLLEGQRVGVGVGASLGEGAEPAAGVADVGEVDVPVDDVGDVVAGDVPADGVGQRAQRVEVRAVRAEQRQVLGVGQPRRGRLGVPQGGVHRPGRRRRARSSARRGRSRCVSAARPSRRRRRRSRRAGRRCARGVDLDVQVGPPGRRPTPRRAPATAARGDPALDGEPVGAGQRGDVRAHPRVQPRLGASTYGGWAASRSRSSNPASAVSAASSSVLGHGPLGVDVVGA